MSVHSDIFSGLRYSRFEQLGPGLEISTSVGRTDPGTYPQQLPNEYELPG